MNTITMYSLQFPFVCSEIIFNPQESRVLLRFFLKLQKKKGGCAIKYFQMFKIQSLKQKTISALPALTSYISRPVAFDFFLKIVSGSCDTSCDLYSQSCLPSKLFCILSELITPFKMFSSVIGSTFGRRYKS